MRRRVLAGLCLLVVVLAVGVFAATAFARPGGGQSFSHGSSPSFSPSHTSPSSGGRSSGHGSSSGSGDAAGELVGAIVDLLWILPWPMKLALFLGILVWAGISHYRSTAHGDWSTASTEIEPPPRRASPAQAPHEDPSSVRHQLARLRDVDPAFSLVLFEDFLYTLYTEVRHAPGVGKLDTLAPYLSASVLAEMKAAPQPLVSAVIVGAMRFTRVHGHMADVVVDVELEVNLTVTEGGKDATLYRVESWSLTRRANAPSRQPERARVIDCPGCGAPLSAVIAGTCSHCNQAVATADLDWRVTRAEVEKEERVPPALTGDVAEAGTDLPTVVDPDANRALEALGERDKSFSLPAFEQRVGLVFREFQVAWSAQELAHMRPFLSDNLFQTQQYWIDAYKKQGLRNVTENARIEGIELARIDSDAWYDAITVRVRATSLDYTLGDGGARVVAGSRDTERSYTEYWTLIRGASRTGPTRTELTCPNCGAPLDINMAGVCKYCQAKVTSGEFDWVLSRIEQDEVYLG